MATLHEIAVHIRDAWMFEGCQGLGLTLEATAGVCFLSWLIVGQHLFDHTEAIKGLGIGSQVDSAHTALAQLADDAILAIVHRLARFERSLCGKRKRRAAMAAKSRSLSILSTAVRTTHNRSPLDSVYPPHSLPGPFDPAHHRRASQDDPGYQSDKGYRYCQRSG